MIIISEDKWDDIKANLLHDLEDDEVSLMPLHRFNHKTNQDEKIGLRETHTFTKNGMDFELTLDKEDKMSDPAQKIYKLSIRFRDVDGSWKDSSAMEKRYEGEE